MIDRRVIASRLLAAWRSRGGRPPEISWIAWIASSQALLAMTDSKESIF
jgi:hypothetical protein